MDAYDRCTNLEKKICLYCYHLWSRKRTYQTTHVSPPPPKPLHKSWFISRHSNYTFCPSWLIHFRHWYLCLYLALGFTIGWNINTGPQSKLSFLTRKFVIGIMYPYNSNKTNAQKSEISTKINVYSYRGAHRRASCSAGVICRGCGVVTCNIQLSVY
jgi:hypothetical protein